MNITTRTSLVGFLLALSALSSSSAGAATATADSANTPAQPTIEGRLAQLTAAIRVRAEQLPESDREIPDRLIVGLGWADGRRGDWVNGRRGGWADGHGGGGWGNVRRWGNGWADGGGFYNYR